MYWLVIALDHRVEFAEYKYFRSLGIGKDHTTHLTFCATAVL